MAEPVPPSACPRCNATLVARVHGPWCPVCRDWIVLRGVSRFEGRGDDGRGSVVTHYVWTIQGSVRERA